MTFRFTLLLMFCAFFFSCENQEKELKTANSIKNSEVIIAGEIINVKSIDSLYLVGIHAEDYFTKELTFEEKKIDSTLKFRFDFTITKQQDIMFLPNDIINLIVEPGDSIYLIVDASKNSRKSKLKSLKISGDNADLNRDFLRYQYLEPMDYNDSREAKNFLKPNEFKKYRDSVHNNRSKFIEDFFTKNDLQEPLKNWLLAESLFSLPCSYSFPDFYYSKDKNIASENKTNLDKFNIYELPIIKPEYFININVSNRIPQMIRDSYIMSSQSEMAKSKKNFLFIDKILTENTHNPYLGKLIVNRFANNMLNQVSVEFFEEYESIIDSTLHGTVFLEPLKLKYENVKFKIANSNTDNNIKLLDFKSKNVSDLLNELVTNANGKPIYIDNWATWCNPCINEIKNHTPKLKEELKGSVEFVYLCYKSDKKQWNDMVSALEINGKHYFIEDDQVEDLNKLFSVNGYPTYSIINGKGELIESNSSMRPSNPKTLALLKELVNSD